MKPRDTDTLQSPDAEDAAATPVELTPEQRARRALMKLAVYAPPAVIGTLLVGRTAYAAPSPSCGPAECVPGCRPSCGPSQPCPPDGP